MGCFSIACGASGVSLSNQDVVLMPLIVSKYPQEGIDDGIHILSNEGTWTNFAPMTLPIRGKLDEYGRVEKIKKNKNTAIIERVFGLPIDDFAEMICGGDLPDEKERQKQRILDFVMDKVPLLRVKPGDNEARRNLVKASNNYANTMNRYAKQRRHVAGMVVHVDAWKAFTQAGPLSKSFFPGNVNTLKLIGFKETGQTSDKRFSRKLSLPETDVEIWSDGTYYHFARDGKIFDHLNSDWTSPELRKLGVEIPKKVLNLASKLPYTIDRVLEMQDRFERIQKFNVRDFDSDSFSKMIRWYGNDIFAPDLRMELAKLLAFGHSMAMVNKIVGPTWSGTQCGEYKRHLKLLKATERILKTNIGRYH